MYENEKNNTAFIIESRLKVMLEEDYVAMHHNSDQWSKKSTKITPDSRALTTELIREIIIPEIEKEVNNGENFVKLRQIYHSLILATWFKRNLKESVFEKLYIGQNKIRGIDIEDKKIKEKIYNQYLESFRLGAYDYIKEEYDLHTQEIIPRKYFSGGAWLVEIDQAMVIQNSTNFLTDKFKTHQKINLHKAGVHLNPKSNRVDFSTLTSKQFNESLLSAKQKIAKKSLEVAEILSAILLNYEKNSIEEKEILKKDMHNDVAHFLKVIITNKIDPNTISQIMNEYSFINKDFLSLYQNLYQLIILSQNNKKIYKLKTHLSNRDKEFYSALQDVLSPLAASKGRLAKTLSSMSDGHLEILHLSGVITQKERDILIEKNMKSFLTMSSIEKESFTKRFQMLLKEYDSLPKGNKSKMMRRLIPLDIVSLLASYFETNMRNTYLIISDHANYLNWLTAANKKASNIYQSVGGKSNAWKIVMTHGLAHTDEWIEDAQKKVETLSKIVVGDVNAWFFIIKHGIKNVDKKVMEAKKKVEEIADRVGGQNNAWSIVKAHSPLTIDAWVNNAEKKVRQIEEIVGGQSNAWDIVRKIQLAEVDTWVKNAKNIVDKIKKDAGGEGKAWDIVIRQGPTKTIEWVKNAKKKVEEIKKRVGGESNAWSFVIMHGLGNIDQWLAQAEKKANKIKFIVKSYSQVWDILRGRSLSTIDDWMSEARQTVNQIKKRVGGEGNAWHIVIRQGPRKAIDWVNKGEKIVDDIEEIVEGRNNAWNIIKSQGVLKALNWVESAKKEINTTAGKKKSWKDIITSGLKETIAENDQNKKHGGNNDAAMLNQKSDIKGGIDLNSNILPLETQGGDIDFNLAVPSEFCMDDDPVGSCTRLTIETLENMPIGGFTPVIFQIVPVNNINMLLGIVNESPPTNHNEAQNLTFIDKYRNKSRI